MMRDQILSTDIDLSSYSLIEFKKLKDSFPGQSDDDLARFFISRHGDYTLAYDLFRKHLDWLEITSKLTKNSIINCLSKKWSKRMGRDKRYSYYCRQ